MSNRLTLQLVLRQACGLQILHRLDDQDLSSLASASRACKVAVTLLLCPSAVDVSNGLEGHAIPFEPTLLDVCSWIRFKRTSPFFDFIYTKHNVLPRSLQSAGSVIGCTPGLQHVPDQLQPPRHTLKRLSSVHIVLDGTVSAAAQQSHVLHVRVFEHWSSSSRYGSAHECGPACSCGPYCPLRATQQGLSVMVVLEWSSKGSAVIARQPIRKGQFVAQYAGEMLSNAEADKRLAQYDQARDYIGHALLVVREMLPSGEACLRFNIDATQCGNIARFFNHSCDGGNLDLEIVRPHGSPLPHVAMFASKNISVGDEITFWYGPSTAPAGYMPSAAQWQQHQNPAKFVPPNSLSALENGTAHIRRCCLCGSTGCQGYLPGSIVT